MTENDAVLVTVPAHFDGDQIKLDIAVELKPGARLLVIILDTASAHEALVASSMKLSEGSFDRVWNNEEDAVYDSL